MAKPGKVQRFRISTLSDDSDDYHQECRVRFLLSERIANVPDFVRIFERASGNVPRWGAIHYPIIIGTVQNCPYTARWKKQYLNMIEYHQELGC